MENQPLTGDETALINIFFAYVRICKNYENYQYSDIYGLRLSYIKEPMMMFINSTITIRSEVSDKMHRFDSLDTLLTLMTSCLKYQWGEFNIHIR